MKTTTTRPSVLGLKILIAVVSVALTLGGWAALAQETPTPSAPNNAPPQNVASPAHSFRSVSSAPTPIAWTRSSR